MLEERKFINSCKWDDVKDASQLLDKNPGLDLTANNDICFSLAVKHKNLEMLNLLMEYYEKQHLAKIEKERPEHLQREKDKLSKILEEALNSFHTSEEIEETIKKYIEENVDNTSEIEDDEFKANYSDDDIMSHESQDWHCNNKQSSFEQLDVSKNYNSPMSGELSLTEIPNTVNNSE